MIYVKKIEYTDNDLEAEVMITDGIYELLCFAHPTKNKEGDEIKGPIYSFDTFGVIKSVDKDFKINKLNSYFGYYITGQIVDKLEGIIIIGDIKIILDTPLPGDLEINDFVSFRSERLDL